MIKAEAIEQGCTFFQFSTRDRMYITQTLHTNVVPSLFVVFSRLSTDRHLSVVQYTV